MKFPSFHRNNTLQRSLSPKCSHSVYSIRLNINHYSFPSFLLCCTSLFKGVKVVNQLLNGYFCECQKIHCLLPLYAYLISLNPCFLQCIMVGRLGRDIHLKISFYNGNFQTYRKIENGIMKPMYPSPSFNIY